MIVGIDLGTTNSLVAWVNKEGKPEIIVNERGSRLTPSVVHFKNEKQVVVGELARSQMFLYPEQTVVRVKRKMGLPFRYTIFGREYTSSEISGLILRKLKSYAEAYLGKSVDRAVITVPAYFDDNQRQATLKAAQLAGITVMKLLNEPTAAALAYNLHAKKESNLLVLDFGGGTFDISLIHFSQGLFEVVATGGSTELGGSDIDDALVQYVVDTVKETEGVDLSQDPVALQQVYFHVERAKIDLSTVQETTVVIPYIALSEKGPVHVRLPISRERLNNLCSHVFKEIERLIEETLERAHVSKEWVQTVIFVGGSSRIPHFRKVVEGIFSGPSVSFCDNLNPDEVVALGAAIQAGIFEGKVREVELRDVLPHSLGILDDEGVFIPILERGTVYPATSSRLFTNARDDQEEVIIEVLQERDGNQLVSLGNFCFQSGRRWKKGEANLEVVFSLDGSGVLNVSAVDVDTGKVEQATIVGGLWRGEQETDFQERRGPGLEVI